MVTIWFEVAIRLAILRGRDRQRRIGHHEGDLALEVDVVVAVLPVHGAGRDAAVEIGLGVALERLDHALARLRLIDQEIALVVDDLRVERVEEHHVGEHGVRGRRRHRLADAVLLAVAGRLAHRRLRGLAPPVPPLVPGAGHVVEAEAGLLDHALPDVDVLDLLRHRDGVDRALAGLPVEQGHRLHGGRQQVLLDRLDHVRDVREHAVVGPARGVRKVEQEAVGEVRRLAGGQRRQHLTRHVLVGVVDVLDVEARFRLERRNRLVELLVLFRVVALVPPDDQVLRERLRRDGGQKRRRQRSSS